MSDIQFLILRVQDLNHSLDWWNKAMIWALVFAAIAAIAIVLTTRIVLTRTKQLADAQENLIRAKDKQLALDLKDRDLKIAEAGSKAATAETKAEEFRLDIAKANEGAKKAEAQAAEAKLELAKIKLPRTIGLAAQERMIKALGEFHETPFDLAVGSDSESVNLMQTLQSVLVKAGWKQVAAGGAIGMSNSNPLIAITLNSGILVEFSAERLPAWLRAADTLIGLLKTEHLEADGKAAQTGVNPNAIHISIGKKPIT